MSAIASVDALLAAMSDNSTPKAHNLFWHHTNRIQGGVGTAPTAGKFQSLWRFDGFPGSGAQLPTTLVNPSNTRRGSLKQPDPSGGRQMWLMGASGLAATGGTLMLYDRLCQQGGLSSSLTSNQSIGSSINRYTDGIGNQLWLEIGVAPGSPASTTFHFDYTDENDGAATTPEMVIGASGFNSTTQILPATLSTVASVGGRGVKNVTNFKLAATSGSSGDYAAVIAHPLALVPSNLGGLLGLRNWLMGARPVEILTDACLALVYIATGSTQSFDFGSLHMVEV